MGRNRVLSFMSQFSNKDSKSSPPASPTLAAPPQQRQPTPRSQPALPNAPATAVHQNVVNPSPQPRAQRTRAQSNPPPRPLSMVQTYQPPLMEVNEQTPEELQPIFQFLNSHSNKLYQEGYFLKLHDQDNQGRPNTDRTWNECFAQLVGTVLSLWDAAELDVAGQDGEVLPTFINLSDASIKMIDALPTRSNDDQPLQNVLSISTAGKNRYLLHFNSHHSLIQWTAGIRLSMYEHTTLQEAYTGALIAGKGKSLNNIMIILEQRRVKYEDWVRVRFGAGTPWRRCWCVINPPDEKEYNKLQKDFNKNKSAYDRSRPPVLKGNVKFYESRKVTKKSQPIATITDAFSAFAIYPQARPLIDSSTLVKLEGNITIHSSPPLITEGFVFVMPEVHPAVSGFEMMLRWLFPVFDTFALYGRPQRLVADTLDPRSLMFAMPKQSRYGYLEILDVSTLILADGSQTWKEADWRKKMKELTARRMTAMMERGNRGSHHSRRSTRASLRPGLADGAASIRSSPSVRFNPRTSIEEEGTFAAIPRTDSAPPRANYMTGQPYSNLKKPHHRSVSEAQGFHRYERENGRDSLDSQEGAPQPPPHQIFPLRGGADSNLKYLNDMPPTPERVSSEDENAPNTPVRELHDLQEPTRPAPVALPPAFSHAPGSMPISKPIQSPELRRANSRMSTGTLAHITGADGIAHAAGTVGHGPPETAQEKEFQERMDASGNRPLQDNIEPVHEYANIEPNMNNANMIPPIEGTVGTGSNRIFAERPLPPAPSGDANNTFTVATNNPYSPSPLSTSQLSSNDTHSPAYNNSPHTPQHGHATTSSIDSTPSKLNRPLSIARKPLPTSSPRSSLQNTPVSHLRASENSSVSIDSYYTAAPVPFDSERGTLIRKPAEARDPDRPRAGVMRTAGNTELGTSNSVATGEPIVPEFDFGPTVRLADVQLQLPSDEPAVEAKREPKRLSKSRHPGHNKTDSTGNSRPSSSNMLRASTPDGNNYHSRTKSGDLYHQRSNSRSADNILLQRPGSRGTPALMNTVGNRSSQHQPAVGGLVGAIEAREREKKEMKQGINSQAVRQALEQQQRHSGIYEQRYSPSLPQGPVAPNFHQQTQEFVQQNSQFPQQQFPQVQQQYPQSQFVPQTYSPMGQPQFPQRGQAYSYGPSPAEQQYQQGYLPSQTPPYQGRGQGY